MKERSSLIREAVDHLQEAAFLKVPFSFFFSFPSLFFFLLFLCWAEVDHLQEIAFFKVPLPF